MCNMYTYNTNNLTQNIQILFLIFLLLLFTYSIKVKRTATLKYDFTLEDIKCYKGIFSVFIVLDHIWMQRPIVSLSFFHECAVILVSIYFFFSGYGVTLSTIRNQEYMGKRFWKKRFRVLVLPMFIADFGMYVWRVKHGFRINYIQYLIGKELPNYQTWYIREVLICYFFFYILTVKRISPKLLVIVCGTFITMLNIILYLLGFGYAWYGSDYGFLLGIVWGFVRGGVFYKFREVKIGSITMISLVLTGAFSIIYKIVGKENVFNILLTRNMMTFTATILFISIASFLVIKTKKYDVISSVSMEIFLLHMLILEVVMEVRIWSNDFTFVMCVLAGVVLVSNIYHRILKKCKIL